MVKTLKNKYFLWLSIFFIGLNLNFFEKVRGVEVGSQEDITGTNIKRNFYILGPGDQISLRIYKFDYFNTKVFILPDGTVNLPRIKSLYIEGLTIDEAKNKILKEYKKVLKIPVIYVDLIKSRPIKISINGEVQRPGFYSIGDEQFNQLSNTDGGESFNINRSGWPTIVDAIQKAGGLKFEANIKEISIQRLDKGNKKFVVKMNLWDALSGENIFYNDYRIFDGDNINIVKSEKESSNEQVLISNSNFAPSTITVNIVGEVTSPGPKNLQANSPLNQAIIYAGGFTTRSNKNSITLLRLLSDGSINKKNFKFKDLQKKTITLKDRDVIVVNKNKFARTSDNLNLITSPLRPLINSASIYKLFSD